MTELLSSDHLDLLVSAALRWRSLTSPAAAAFSPAGTPLVVATGEQAGRLVQQENLAALRWLSDRGRSRLADRVVPPLYTFTEVEHLVPVEVIKACQAAEAMCASSPGWAGSAARRLVHAIAAAATHRLDGYPAAPWQWTRPHRRCGVPVAAGGAWRPPLPGVTWIGVDQLGEHWDSASLVIVTTEVATEAPQDLPPRCGVFILAAEQPQAEVWKAIVALDDQAVVLFWPACQPWLAEQVADPAPEYVEHRQQRP